MLNKSGKGYESFLGYHEGIENQWENLTSHGSFKALRRDGHK